METIYETYARNICRNCKNKEECQEELHQKLDSTIKCEKYIPIIVHKKKIFSKKW